jgi:ABC-2 type transport system permease protein
MTDARIVDARYRPFEGSIEQGSRGAIMSMARWSALRALGARRRWTAKVVPVGLALIALGPAITALGVQALLGDQLGQGGLPVDLVPYAPYYGLISFAILAYAALIIPETICPDRRSRVLDLYLSTALSARDYVLGKLLAALVPLLTVTTVPLLVLYVGNVFFSPAPITYVQEHLRELPAIIAGGLVIALFYALLGLAISSLTDRRAFASVGFVILLVASGVISGALDQVADIGRGAEYLNVSELPVRLAQQLIGNEAGDVIDGPLAPEDPLPVLPLIAANAVVMGLSSLILFLRYRRVAR